MWCYSLYTHWHLLRTKSFIHMPIDRADSLLSSVGKATQCRQCSHSQCWWLLTACTTATTVTPLVILAQSFQLQPLVGYNTCNSLMFVFHLIWVSTACNSDSDRQLIGALIHVMSVAKAFHSLECGNEIKLSGNSPFIWGDYPNLSWGLKSFWNHKQVFPDILVQ